jgi:hypothetical protein
MDATITVATKRSSDSMLKMCRIKNVKALNPNKQMIDQSGALKFRRIQNAIITTLPNTLARNGDCLMSVRMISMLLFTEKKISYYRDFH